MRRIIVMLCLGLCLAAGCVSTAAAHTGLLASDPAEGEVLPRQPAQVALTFRDAVGISGEAIRVYDDRMRRVDLGGYTSTADRRVVRVDLPGGLERGTFSVAWQVVSPDGHPTSGVFRFSIGGQSRVVGQIPTAGEELSDAVLMAARGFGYVGLALGPGVLLIVLWLCPRALADTRTRRLMWAGLGVLAISTLTVLATHTAWIGGQPLSEAWTGSSVNETGGVAEYAYAARFYCMLALGVAMALATVLRLATRPVRLVTTVVVAALLVTWPLTGHTGNGVPSAVADVVHLGAMTVWLGGLAFAVVVLTRPGMVVELVDVLPRFSRLAFGSVVALVLTGTYQAWRELGSLTGLTSSSFGQLLLLKLVGVVTVVGLGGLARQWLRRHLSDAPTPLATGGRTALMVARGVDRAQIRALRRGLVLELVLGAGVLAVTAALVVTSPPV